MKKKVYEHQHCLECGDVVDYGRRDKKFCSDDCKNSYNNKKVRLEKEFKNKVKASIDKNYQILLNLTRLGIRAIDKSELVSQGFQCDCVTGFRKMQYHDEYRCYDIRYYMSSARVFCIERTPCCIVAPTDDSCQDI